MLFSDTIRRCLQGLLFRKTPLLPRRNEVVSAQLVPVGITRLRCENLTRAAEAEVLTARACFFSRRKKNWRFRTPKVCLKRFGRCQAWRRHAPFSRRSPKIQKKEGQPTCGQ